MTQEKPSAQERKDAQAQDADNKKALKFDTSLAALREAEIKAVSEQLHIRNPELAGQIVDLGFGKETVAAFPLIPLVYVAWADGEVSTRERERVMKLAATKGLKEDGDAYNFLSDLLERRPKDDFLDICVDVIRQVFDGMTESNATSAKADLLSLCHQIAEASGGFLGLFGDKVSAEERDMLKEIADGLGSSDAANKLLGKLG